MLLLLMYRVFSLSLLIIVEPYNYSSNRWKVVWGGLVSLVIHCATSKFLFCPCSVSMKCGDAGNGPNILPTTRTQQSIAHCVANMGTALAFCG